MQYIKIYITYYLFAFKSDSAIPSIAFLTLAKNHPEIHHSQPHIIMVMGTCPQPHMQYIKISHQALVLVVWERVLLRS